MRKQFTAVALTLGMALAGLLMVTRDVQAQATASASLQGTLTDQSAGVIVGATATLTNKDQGWTRTAITTSAGFYRFELLAAGVYSLRIKQTGFATISADHVELLVGQTTTLDFQMKPGQVSEIVEVSAAAPLLDVEKTSVGLQVTPTMVENMPLNGRDFANLAYLAPGAKATAPWDPTKARVSGVGINGSNGRNMNITVNGVDDKDNTVGGPVMQLPLEAVQEFNISTQRFSAANGRSAGSAVNVITRSGSNNFHGSAYLFDTQTALNANDKLNGNNPTPQFERQQFGGRFGGPIMKDKDFGFFAWERLREHTAIPVLPSALSELSLVQNLNLGNITLAAQPAATIPTPYTDTRYNGRLDHNFNANHHFFLSFATQGNRDLNDQSGNANDLSEGNFQTNQLYVANATLNSVLSPRLVNSFTAGWQYWNNLIDSTTRAPLVTFLPTSENISFGTNGNVPQQSYQKKWQFRDDISFTQGKHGMKFGVDYLWEPQLGGYFEFNSTLALEFQDLPSTILNNTTLYPAGFNTPGAVTSMSISLGDPNEDLPGGGKMLGLYFQDTWKTSRRLTLDLGVRYDRDFNLMASNTQGKSRTFLLLQAITSPFAGIPQDYKKGFSPRVGFAYDVGGNSNNVLRGGYGLYIDQTFLNIPLFMIQQARPTIFATIFSLSGTDVVPGTSIPLSSYRLGIDPLPTIPPPATSFADLVQCPGPCSHPVGRLMAPDYRNPYSQEWNVGFAHSFNANTVAEIEYVHELGLHEEKRAFLNYINQTDNPASPCTATSCSGGVRVLSSALAAAGQPQIGRVSMETSWGRSRYDGMNVSLRRRMANRFSINTTYTLSKGLAYNGNAASYSNAITDPRFPLLPTDFGPVPNDERHHLSVSGVVDLPWGFQIAPIMQVASARPYNATTGVSNVLGFGSGPAAAHAIVPTSDPSNIFFGLTQTTAQLRNCYLVTLTCKQAGFNFLRGQPFFDMDMRVTKLIKFGERSNLKLIFQTFDLTNRANYGNNYDGNVRNSLASNGSTFGTPLGYIGCNANGCNRTIPISFRAEFGGQFTF